MNDEPTNDESECVHLLTPTTCAYCTGSYQRERAALEAETRQMLRRMAAKRDRDARSAGPVRRSTSDERLYQRSTGWKDTRREAAAVRTQGFRLD